MTNADKLRKMSDEELATFIASSDDRCPDGHFLGDYDCMSMRCEDCWIDWLEQEAEE